MAVVLLAILITLMVYYNVGNDFFLYIPLFSLFITFLYPLITDVDTSIQLETNTATIILRLFTSGLIFFVASRLIIEHGITKLSLVVLLFLGYLVALSFISNSITTAWTRTLMVGANILMLPASIVYFRKEENKSKFYKLLLITNIVAIVYIAFASVYRIGAVIYQNDLITYGGFNLFGLYLFVFSIPFFLDRQNIKPSIVNIVVIVVEVLILLLSLKRTYLLFAGFFFLSFLLSQFYQNKIKLSSLSVLFVLILSFLYFGDVIIESMNTREKYLNESIEEEGRYIEYLIYIDENINNVTHKTLIGQNLFNNRGEFGRNNKYGLNTENRTLHSDYVTILYGAGILGFLFLLYLYYTLIKMFSKIRTYLKRLRISRSKLLLAYSYIAALIISQAIDGLFIFWARGIPFLILGYIIADLKGDINKTIETRISNVKF